MKNLIIIIVSLLIIGICIGIYFLRSKPQVVEESQMFIDTGTVIGISNEKAKQIGIFDNYMSSDPKRDPATNIWSVYWAPRNATEIKPGDRGVTIYIDMNSQTVTQLLYDK
jgi:hypothetical protein